MITDHNIDHHLHKQVYHKQKYRTSIHITIIYRFGIIDTRHCSDNPRIEHVTDRVENVLGHGQGGSILVHVGTNNADREGTTRIVQRYRQLVGKLKKTRVEQIILSGILPVIGGRGAPYRNCKRMAINALVEQMCEEEGVGFLDLWGRFVGMEDMYVRDGLHLRGTGAAVFSENLLQSTDSGTGCNYLN